MKSRVQKLNGAVVSALSSIRHRVQPHRILLRRLMFVGVLWLSVIGLNTAAHVWLKQKQKDAISAQIQAEEKVRQLEAAVALEKWYKSLGYTSLMAAANHGDIDTVVRLLHDGASANAKTSSGDTALHCAVIGHGTPGDKARMVRVLLDHGADPNTLSPAGLALSLVARDRGLWEIAQILTVAGLTRLE